MPRHSEHPTVEDVLVNIESYRDGLADSRRLRHAAKFVRWWVAAGSKAYWSFAPVSFVGEPGMTLERYQALIGRRSSTYPGRDLLKSTSPQFERVELHPSPRATGTVRGEQATTRHAKMDGHPPKLLTLLKSELGEFLDRFGTWPGAALTGFVILRGSEMPLSKQVKQAEARWHGRIVSDRGICGGRPRIIGTRMRAIDIVEMVGGGMTVDEILGDFSYITREDVKAALAFDDTARMRVVLTAA